MADAADQIERDGREIKRLEVENERLRVNRDFWKARFQIEARTRIRMQEALSDLAANTHLAEGECDWPKGQDPLSRARAALSGEGET